MAIKNVLGLAINDNRKKALQIAEAGLLAINTEKVLEKNVSLDGGVLKIKDEKIGLSDIKRIFVVCIGKCSVEAAQTLERILGDRLTGGIALGTHGGEAKKIEILVGDHPFSTPRNIDATKKIIDFLSETKKTDLVIFVISGGGSALLCQPEELKCEDEKLVIERLFKAGAGIKEINIIRKHISLARGGHLVKYVYPAKVVSLIFSDVLGDDLEFIASGPTVLDTTTKEDAEKIISKYGIDKECGKINEGLIETPKDKKYFEQVKNILLVSNKVALEAMKEKTEELGLSAKIVSTELAGEARKVGQNLAERLHDTKRGKVLLCGGETTVIIKGQGMGGRNMELALSALRFLKDDELILTIASDGKDNSDFAGAICDYITKEKVGHLGLNIDKYLESNNSYGFFKEIKDAIITGNTGSNVADLTILIKN